MYMLLFYAFIASLSATIIVLLTGITGFFLGGSFNQKYGHKLMRMRVFLQGITIAFFALLLLIKGI